MFLKKEIYIEVTHAKMDPMLKGHSLKVRCNPNCNYFR